MNTTNQSITQPAFLLKGSVLTVSVLQLLNNDTDAFALQLNNVTGKNPDFFDHMPLIIDLQKLSDNDINFAEINSLLRQRGFVPVGITNATSQQSVAAISAGFGVLPNLKTSEPKVIKKIEPAKIISQPVRSGQQIYAKDADLIVLASVGNGAEIIADGNIHVYGALRGRAIAGAAGEQSARIFCQKFEAELVSIAGHYKLQENIEFTHDSTCVQVFLENDQLIITSVN